MKKAISVLLTFVMILGAVAVGGMSVSADGDGIVFNGADNRYEISDYAGLKEFASIVNGTHADIAQNTAAYAILIDDIDASASAQANDWTPIGNNSKQYTGTFDGDGHKIAGLTFNNTSADYAGLFGYVGEGGKVQNVGLEGGSITGYYNVGGVAGYNNNGGTVTNCYNTGDVSGSGFYVGGAVGLNDGTITNCYNTGDVSGSGFYVGGAVGVNNGTITNCYNTGSVTATADHAYVGGVVGYNYDNSSVENCYNTGSVTATGNDAFVCGVVGLNIGTVRYCYYDKSVCGEIGAVDAYGNTNNVKGLSTAQMTGTSAIGTADTQMNFSDTSVWLVRAADEFYSYYPHLKGFDLDNSDEQIPAENIRKTEWPARVLQNNAREISDYDELKAFANDVNNVNSSFNGILLNDIDASASATGNKWTPICNDLNSYTGTFDGDGYKITGLTFNNPEQTDAGLFGYVDYGGVVRNVGLEGGSITGRLFVGGVAGDNNGTITNCYNTGDVSGSDYVGGIVGRKTDGTITKCYNTGDVTATSATAYVGGIAGENDHTIENCYNTGDVSATSSNASVGGVAGYNNGGTVTNCYNTGSVIATGSSSYVGGVVGFNYEGTITNCYNTGEVSGTNYAGGVIGNFNRGEVTNCYYDRDRCALSKAIGKTDDTDTVKGLTTAQMTGENALSNMTGFSDTDWITKADEVGDDGAYYWFYPHLKGFDYDLTAASEDWPAKTEVTVTGDSCTYDGRAHEVYVTVGDTSVPEGASVIYFEYTYYEDNRWEWKGISDTPTETGKYRMEFDNDDGVVETKYFTILDPYTDFTVSYYKKTGEDWSTDPVTPVDAGDYKAVLTFTASGHAPIEKEFGIKRKAVTITAESASKIYDGTPLRQSGFTATDLEEGDTHTFTVKMTTGNTITDVGIIGNVIAEVDGVTVTAGTAVEVGNYLVTTVNGTLTIKPVTDEVTVTITGNSDTADYDGEEHAVSGYDVEISNPLYTESDFRFNGTAEAKRTDPGTENMGLDESQFSNYNRNFDNVTFVIAEDGKLTVNPVITFVNEDGTELQSGAVALGETPEYKGETPVKTENDGYTYEFAAWSPEIKAATENMTYTATYTNMIIKYTATFVDENGNTVGIRTFDVNTASIDEPEVPVKEGYEGKWEEYTLGLESITVKPVYTPNEYTITYVVDDNETEVKYDFGAPVEKPADPVKDGFNFIGWDKEIPDTMPAEDLTITAEFEAIPEPVEPTPTEPTPTEPTPTEPTPTEPTPTEPTSTEPTPTEPTPTEPTPTEPTPTEPTPTEPTPTDTEPAHEHSYKGEVTTKPTCTEDGIMTYTCECGESYTKAIPKTGHKPGEWTVVTPATTEAAGKEVRKCTVCGEVLAEREIAKLEPQETDAGIVSVNLEKTNAFGIANAFGVDPEKLPAGSTVTWYVNGEKAGEGNGFRVDNPTEDYTIKAVVTNRDGKVIGETEETTVKVNNSFFARLYYWLCRIIQKVIDLFNK